ncbi:MAG: dynamin family protein [Acidobacteriota bacterium]|nr:dynamin family protein [Acidobacteriota bacterium]
MMNWESVRIEYLSKLERAAIIVNQGLTICAHAHLQLRDTEGIGEALKRRINIQIEKLRDNRFEVALVGLEKAGKSTLLNAWLGHLLLPARDERCTYTTTEIRSAASLAEQRYEVDYHTPEDFLKTLAATEKTFANMPEGTDRARLAKELDELRRVKSSVLKNDRASRKVETFLCVEEVRDDLKRLIADPMNARAIARITIHTPLLTETRNIIFHDVPGFDSPVTLHQRQALERLASADAIIYAKAFRPPDLVVNEVQMLEAADREDEHVKLKGKVIVALTHVDSAVSRQQFLELVASAQRIWKDKAELSPDRVIPVCPLAELILRGTAGSDGMQAKEEVLTRMRVLRAGEVDVSGISALKAEVNRYIEQDRARVLQNRCEGLLSDAERFRSSISKNIRIAYPGAEINAEAADRVYEQRRFDDWWAKEWTQIHKEFHEFYYQRVRPRINPDDTPQISDPLKTFQKQYASGIDAFIKSLPCDDASLRKLYQYAADGPSGVSDPLRGHVELRKHITESAQKNVKTVVLAKADCLTELMKTTLSWIHQRFWCIPETQAELGADADALLRFMSGVQTVFLRFARPAINLFLWAPRFSRERLLEQYKADVSILQQHYQGKDKASRNLDIFLSVGAWMVEQSSLGEAKKIFNGMLSQNKRKEESLASISLEIREDVQALADYLKESVFYAAGFFDICHQHMEDLKNEFELRGANRRWYDIVRSAYIYGHPDVCAVAPKCDAETKIRREVLAELKILENLGLTTSSDGIPFAA